MWVVTDDSSCKCYQKDSKHCRCIFSSYDSINNVLFSLVYFKNTDYNTYTKYVLVDSSYFW